MDNNKLDSYSKVLVFAVVISPFTLLRFDIIGIAEIIFAITFFKVFKIWRTTDLFFTRFWFHYLILCIIGYCYNNIFLVNSTGILDDMLFDFFAYLLVLMSCYSMENLIIYGNLNPYVFLRYVYYASSVLMSFLYIISFYTSNIFGIPLLYHEYFAPLAKNLHQISMFLVPLPFIGLALLKDEKNVLLKLLIVILMVSDIIMAFNTGSTKAFLSIYVGAISYICVRSYLSNRMLFVVLVAILLLFVLVQYEVIFKLAFDSFVEYDLAGGRAYLYANAFNVGKDSILFGHGAGTHVWYGGKYWDSHQTFLTTFLQTGIVGTMLLLILFYKLFYKLKDNPAIFAACSAIFIYASGGDVLRRLPVWIFLVIFYYLDSKLSVHANQFTGRYS